VRIRIQRVHPEAILPRYIAEGFTVITHPSSDVLPEFMRNYRPDAVALRSDKKIAIEIKTDEPSTRKGIEQTKDLFSHHPDWEFRVYYVPKYPEEIPLQAATRREIEYYINEMTTLRDTGHLVASILVAWAVLEAVGRILAPEQLARPQPPAQLVEVLAAEGYVSQAEADALRRGARLRNAAVHGHLAATATPESADELLAIVRRLEKSLRRSRSGM
jgi:uncharacterized protein YutE (UPF0331/DUF86 family)